MFFSYFKNWKRPNKYLSRLFRDKFVSIVGYSDIFFNSFWSTNQVSILIHKFFLVYKYFYFLNNKDIFRFSFFFSIYYLSIFYFSLAYIYYFSNILFLFKKFLSLDKYFVTKWIGRPFKTYFRGLDRRKKLWWKKHYLKQKNRKFFGIITYKITKTNIYLTITDLSGNVIISISSGMLGWKKRWQRLFVGNFNLLILKALRQLRKVSKVKNLICIVRHYREAYYRTLLWHIHFMRFNLKKILFIPYQIHGKPLRQRRLKRL
mgnify:CR=1 FL=1